jgi:hypothetical protein
MSKQEMSQRVLQSPAATGGHKNQEEDEHAQNPIFPIVD